MNNEIDKNGFEERRKVDLFRESAEVKPIVETATALRGPTPLPAPANFELSDSQAGSSLQNFLAILGRQWWKLAIFVACSAAAAAGLTLLLTPLFESAVAINVERRGSGVLGKDADAPSTSEMDQIMATQIELIESDPVLRPVAEKYHLLEMEHRFRWMDASETDRLRKAKTVLKQLKVVRPANTSILHISYRATEPALAADIANTIAASYLQHAFDSRQQSDSTVLNVADRQLGDLKQKIIASMSRWPLMRGSWVSSIPSNT